MVSQNPRKINRTRCVNNVNAKQTVVRACERGSRTATSHYRCIMHYRAPTLAALLAHRPGILTDVLAQQDLAKHSVSNLVEERGKELWLFLEEKKSARETESKSSPTDEILFRF